MSRCTHDRAVADVSGEELGALRLHLRARERAEQRVRRAERWREVLGTQIPRDSAELPPRIVLPPAGPFAARGSPSKVITQMSSTSATRVQRIHPRPATIA